jgi:hypothetical protein
MMDAKPSTFSRSLRSFAVEPARDDKLMRERDEDRVAATAEIERKFAEGDEGFFWTWQYSGQW